MQAGADTLPHPIALAERRAVANPVDHPKRDIAEPDPQPNRRADPVGDARGAAHGDAHEVTLELV